MRDVDEALARVRAVSAALDALDASAKDTEALRALAALLREAAAEADRMADEPDAKRAGDDDATP